MSETSNHSFRRFTLDEYMDLAVNGTHGLPGHHRSSRDTHRNHWHGTRSFEHAVELATKGWPEGCEKMANIVAQLDSLTASYVTAPQPMMDVTGDYVDVATFIQGVPENMVRWEETEVTSRVARILCHCSVSGGVSVDVIQWKGATVLALIDRLEAQGIRVELDIMHKTRQGKYSDTIIYTVKKAQEPLPIDRLAFHLVNPSSLRRISFSACENSPTYIAERMGYDCGYGSPAKVSEEEGREYNLIVPELHLSTVKQAVEEIEKMFNHVCQVEALTNVN